jgi:DNA-binding NtrC family response regulator
MTRPEPENALELAQVTHLRLLVVDDSERIGELMRAILTRVEHAVDVVHSPDEAITRLKCKHYDVVISELFLCKDLSGPELARAIRQRWSDVGFILATGSMALVSANGPVDAVLMKPFGASVLRELVVRVASTHCTDPTP